MDHMSQAFPGQKMEPLADKPMIAPWDTSFVDDIEITPFGSHGAAISAKDDGKEIKNAANLITLTRARIPLPRHKQFERYELYPDGAGEDLSYWAGGAQIFKFPANSNCFQHAEKVGKPIMVPAGKNSCSYRAESVAMEAGLKELVRIIGKRRKKRRSFLIVVASDSQSLLQKLKTGPIRCARSYMESLIMLHLKKLVELGAIVRMVHVFSHCGTEGNEVADQTADRALVERANDHQQAMIWSVDALTTYKRALVANWHDSIPTTERTRLVGKKKLKLRNMAGWPVELQRFACQVRCGESSLFGPLYFAIRGDPVGECRACLRDKMLRMQSLKDSSRGDKAPVAAAVVETITITNNRKPLRRLRVECPLCGKEYSSWSGVKDHHNREHAHQEFRKPTEYDCLWCDMVFHSTTSRAQHLRWCEKNPHPNRNNGVSRTSDNATYVAKDISVSDQLRSRDPRDRESTEHFLSCHLQVPEREWAKYLASKEGVEELYAFVLCLPV
jgi:DNA-directed RNA polymerase subunit M/transcription elongation factor TFIIS